MSHIAPRLAQRARIVLAAASGQTLRGIARRLGLSHLTVRKWCRRFGEQGVPGLADAARLGRLRRISPGERCLVIATACQDPQAHGLPGHSQWSGRLLAEILIRCNRVARISARSVQRILEAAAIKPHRCHYWKQPIDPGFVAKMRPTT